MNKHYYKACSILLIISAAALWCKQYNPEKNNKGTMMNQPTIGDTLNTASFQQTSSGIKYFVLQEGKGSTPFKGELVTAHYTGWLFDPKTNIVGKKFDSSVDRNTPFSFPIKQGYVIAGWDDMISEMKAGEKRLIILPSNKAYGAQSVGNIIPAHATLLFEVELLKIG